MSGINTNYTNINSLFANYLASATTSNKANTQGSQPQAQETQEKSPFSLLGSVGNIGNFVDNFGKQDPANGAISGATVGAQLGSILPGIGTAFGTAIGAIVGGVSSLFGSGKPESQKKRDQVRKWMQDNQIIDQNWSVTLADGSKYDIGIDGKNKLTNLDGTTRNHYDVDFSHPLAAQTVAWANPIFEALLGDQEDLKTQFVGYFVNAALSYAEDLETARQNLVEMFGAFNVSPEEVLQGLVASAEQGRIDEQTLMIHINNVESLLTVPEPI